MPHPPSPRSHARRGGHAIRADAVDAPGIVVDIGRGGRTERRRGIRRRCCSTDELADVAADVDWTAGELANTLLTDDSLFVTDAATSGTPTRHRDLVSSRPSSRRRRTPTRPPSSRCTRSRPRSLTIFLDFDGHVTTDTGWNSGRRLTSCPPRSIATGIRARCHRAEVAEIEAVWRIVAEDFAPFNVDVTTEDPGTAALKFSGGGDAEYGTRIVISPDRRLVRRWVWRRRLRRVVQVEHAGVRVLRQPRQLQVGRRRVVPRVRSHARPAPRRSSAEDRTTRATANGARSWGTATRVRSAQWSKGEYAGADRANEDDLAVIAAFLGYRFDDHGDTTPTATQLAGTGETSGFVGANDRRRRVHGRRSGRRHRRPGDAVVDRVEPVRLRHDPQRRRCDRRLGHADRGRPRRVDEQRVAPDRMDCARRRPSCPPAGTRRGQARRARTRRRPASARTARTARTDSPSPSAPSTPPPAPTLPGQVRLTPVQPVRLADTRSGQGASVRLACDGVLRRARSPARSDVPADVTAAALNVTAVGPDSGGFLTVYPVLGRGPDDVDGELRARPRHRQLDDRDARPSTETCACTRRPRRT